MERFEGVGVTARELVPGHVVMVPVGAIPAVINGGPCVIAWAVVRGPASAVEAASYADPATIWWLDVYMGPAVFIPQMYRADDILGVPAIGLQMTGAPLAWVP